MTPCVAASGANICGRQDAVACPRHISLGTVVEIRGTTYVCEDRLAKKFDSRFDISCDKDTACPPTVTGWATITVYDNPRSDVVVTAAPAIVRSGRNNLIQHAVAHVRPIAHAIRRLASAAATTTVLRGRA